MIRIPAKDREEGQIIPALLLVVVALIFFGLLFVQVGSAAEQKTQTQTAADSAAVSAAHAMRDSGVVAAGYLMHWKFSAPFKGFPVPDPELQATACDAAQRNWDSNPHNGAGFDCGQLNAYPISGGVRVELIAPPGQVVSGPAKVADEKAQADATADVVLGHCSQLPNKYQKDVADFLIDHALEALGSSSFCFTPDEETELDELDADDPFGAAAALIGPPALIYDAVRNSLRTQLTDD